MFNVVIQTRIFESTEVQCDTEIWNLSQFDEKPFKPGKLYIKLYTKKSFHDMKLILRIFLRIFLSKIAKKILQHDFL